MTDLPTIAPDAIRALYLNLLGCESETDVLNLVVNIDDADLLEAAVAMADSGGLDAAYSLIARDRVAIIRRPGDGEQGHVDVLETFTKNLPVELTDDERHTAAGHVVVLTDEIDALKVEAKAAADNFKARIQLKEADRSAEAAKWRSGKEVRGVECQVGFDIVADRVNTIRTDTGETIDTRAPSDDERQRPLPFAAKAPESDEDGDRDEEPSEEPAPVSRGRKARSAAK